MRVEELRIGNYTYPFDDINLVDDKTIFRDLIEVTYKDIKDTYNLHPIPLTEEWLLKFGFEKLEGWDDTFFFQLNNVQITDYNVSGCDYDSFNIRHVHQLQNLYFALTGEELKLKENE